MTVLHIDASTMRQRSLDLLTITDAMIAVLSTASGHWEVSNFEGVLLPPYSPLARLANQANPAFVMKLTAAEMRDFSRVEQTIWLYLMFDGGERKMWLTVFDSSLWELACTNSEDLDALAGELCRMGIDARREIVDRLLSEY